MLTLKEYREKFKGLSDEQLFKKYTALEMPGGEYIIKDIDKVKEYTKNSILKSINESQTQPTKDNKAPTKNDDTRYSQNKEGKWQNRLDTVYNFNQKQKTKTEDIKIRQRGVLNSMQRNNNTPDAIKKGLSEIDQNYIVITDQDAMDKAAQNIETKGIDKSYDALKTKYDSNMSFSKYDMAEATLLYNDAYSKGDITKALDILTDMAVIGTNSGQVSQALSILYKSTPDGRLMAIQKQLNKINEKNKTDIKISEEDIKAVKDSKGQKELDDALNKTLTNISEKLPKTLSDRLNEYRYLSMLGNPKTHIRNITSNLVMKGVAKAKNKLSGLLQDTFIKDETQKTQTWEKVLAICPETVGIYCNA